MSGKCAFENRSKRPLVDLSFNQTRAMKGKKVNFHSLIIHQYMALLLKLYYDYIGYMMYYPEVYCGPPPQSFS